MAEGAAAAGGKAAKTGWQYDLYRTLREAGVTRCPGPGDAQLSRWRSGAEPLGEGVPGRVRGLVDRFRAGRGAHGGGRRSLEEPIGPAVPPPSFQVSVQGRYDQCE